MRYAIAAALFLLTACHTPRTVTNVPEMPPVIVWAWERPEDLTFLDAERHGVAFLAQTLTLRNDEIDFKPRRQPLEVAPGSYVIAVSRIETVKDAARPAFSDEQLRRTVDLIRATADLPDVRSVQIDFDAVASERKFYRRMMNELRERLPAELPLTMTSLASWCVGDAWFNDFPVNEAVPMAFQMGTDDEFIRRFLRDGKDWNEPLCRGSYGVALEEPLDITFSPGRRIFYFKNTPWRPADLEKIKPL